MSQSKKEKINEFDPSGVGVHNEHFIGLPFEEAEAEVIILPVPWDATVSYREGTSSAAENILQASYQLDLYDEGIKDAWEMGIYMRKPDAGLKSLNTLTREKAKVCIGLLESGTDYENELLEEMQGAVNSACEKMVDWVYQQSGEILKAGKRVALLGGDHSTPLGYLKALAERYPAFSVLQIDAHMDLREAYEGFHYSHASVFYNALKIEQIDKLVQVGIRDCCQFEMDFYKQNQDRISLFTDRQVKAGLFSGRTFHAICEEIIANLSQYVYISFDIDGLAPLLCPGTGTPVPGGLSYEQATYLLEAIVNSGRQMIGFDLSEVAGVGYEWDGNVGARLLYQLCNLMGFSSGKI